MADNTQVQTRYDYPVLSERYGQELYQEELSFDKDLEILNMLWGKKVPVEEITGISHKSLMQLLKKDRKTFYKLLGIILNAKKYIDFGSLKNSELRDIFKHFFSLNGSWLPSYSDIAKSVKDFVLDLVEGMKARGINKIKLGNSEPQGT